LKIEDFTHQTFHSNFARTFGIKKLVPRSIARRCLCDLS